jgi:hypothetical protein
MTAAQTYTWIFLSLSEQPASLRGVAEVADAINHAVPTHEELSSSITWLTAQGLVEKRGGCYLYTHQGTELRRNSLGPKMLLRESQVAIKDYFGKIITE